MAVSAAIKYVDWVYDTPTSSEIKIWWPKKCIQTAAFNFFVLHLFESVCNKCHACVFAFSGTPALLWRKAPILFWWAYNARYASPNSGGQRICIGDSGLFQSHGKTFVERKVFWLICPASYKFHKALVVGMIRIIEGYRVLVYTIANGTYQSAQLYNRGPFASKSQSVLSKSKRRNCISFSIRINDSIDGSLAYGTKSRSVVRMHAAIYSRTVHAFAI